VPEPGDHRVLELETLLAQHQDASVALPRAGRRCGLRDLHLGSTGQPKGEIPIDALSNFLLSMAQEPGFTRRPHRRRDHVLVRYFGPRTVLPLVTGGQVFVAGHAEVRTGYELVSRLKAQASTVLQATPSLWRMLLEAGFKAPQASRFSCGGEPLPRDLADALLATGAEV
jgi:non-ribosomal peptide synthetase component F